MLNFNVNLANAGGFMLVVYIVIAVVISGFTARVASEKGHDGVGWFFLGLVTGFVGLAIALAMPQATSSYEDTRDSEFWSRKTEEKNGEADDDRASFEG